MKGRRSRMRRTVGAVLATAAVLLTLATPAQASQPTPATLYQLAGTASCTKSVNNCVLYPKAAALPSGRLVAAFEESTVQASGSADGQTIPVYKSDDNGTTWQHLADVKAPAYASSNSAYAAYVSNWTNPYLYVLPQSVGNLASGTLLMATVVSGDDYYYLDQKKTNPNYTPTHDGDRSNTAIALYASTDSGSTWNVVNIIATGSWSNGANYPATENTYHQNDPVWEPYLMVYNNQLVCYYSDENDYTGYNSSTGALTIDPANATATDSHGQVIAHRTWDGSSSAWSSAVVDVTGDTVSMGNGKTEIGGGRPGMANVVQTSDGQWMLTYEYWGGGDNVRYKLSGNPLQFFAVGGADGTGISGLPVSAGSSALSQGGNPVLVRLPGGRLIYNAGGSGDVWVNASGSGTGSWTEYQTTLPAAYSRNLTYDATTGRVVILANQGTSTIINADIDFGHSTGTYYQIVNKLTGQVIGTHNNTTDANIGNGNSPDVDLENAGSAANPDTQYWHLVTKPGGVTLLNEAGGRAAEIWGGNATAGAGIGQWVDNTSTGLWNMVKLADGNYQFQSTGNTGLYLTGASSGAGLTLQTARSDGSQEWQLVAANAAGIAGSGRTLTNVNTATCLDDYKWNTANGADVDLWPCNGLAVQQFTVTSTGDGQYTLTNANSGSCLDDYQFGTANGSKADLWSCTGAANQNWSFVPIAGGNYEIINQSSGLCLDDPQWNKTSGVLADLWTCNEGANQQWHF